MDVFSASRVCSGVALPSPASGMLRQEFILAQIHRSITDFSLWGQAMLCGKGVRTEKEVLEPRSGTVTFLDVVELRLPASFTKWNMDFCKLQKPRFPSQLYKKGKL